MKVEDNHVHDYVANGCPYCYVLDKANVTLERKLTILEPQYIYTLKKHSWRFGKSQTN